VPYWVTDGARRAAALGFSRGRGFPRILEKFAIAAGLDRGVTGGSICVHFLPSKPDARGRSSTLKLGRAVRTSVGAEEHLKDKVSYVHGRARPTYEPTVTTTYPSSVIFKEQYTICL